MRNGIGDFNRNVKIAEVDFTITGHNADGTIIMGSPTSQFVAAPPPYTRTLGNKSYELTDHLGDVLMTVSDRKIPNGAIGGQVNYFTADVMNSTDYYPFGEAINSRKSSVGSYRFAYNGKEHDDETYGDKNEYDYGKRMYDPRLGKFMSVDPMIKSYPWNAPYTYAENDVIRSGDLDGKEKIIVQYWGSPGAFKAFPSNDVINLAAQIVVNSHGLPTDGTFKEYVTPKDHYTTYTYTPTVNGFDDPNYGKALTVRFTNHEFNKAVSDADRFLFETKRAEREAMNTVNRSLLCAGIIFGSYSWATEEIGATQRGVGLSTGTLYGITAEEFATGSASGTSIVESDGIATIASYLNKMGFDNSAGNKIMMSRLNQIAAGELEATQIDVNFYSHELREQELVQSGLSQQEAHYQVLQEQGMYETEYDQQLYTKEALDADNQQLLDEAAGKK